MSSELVPFILLHWPLLSSLPITWPKGMMINNLKIVKTLLDAWERSGVVYCHWKSNQHLKAGLTGDTDLDILVDQHDISHARIALNSVGFKRFNSTSSRAYVGIEDFIGFDVDTGRLVHIHLHYRLIVGEKHLKGHRLPWEHVVLESRIFSETSGIYVADPNIEFILLVVREALKMTTRHRFGIRPVLAPAVRKEYDWLIERIDRKALHSFCNQLLPARAVHHILGCAETPPTKVALLRLRNDAALDVYATYHRIPRRLARWAREIAWLIHGVNKRFLNLAIPFGRIGSGGGAIVVFLGADGSGKSTMLPLVNKWLQWKLQVVTIYFGSGDGPSSVLRWPLKQIRTLIKRNQQKPATSVDAPSASSDSGNMPQSAVYRFARPIWALTLALEKRAKLTRAMRARNRGLVVITDRFPQNQFEGINDGPLLGSWLEHDSPILRRLANWERWPYENAQRIALPDLVIKLTAPLPVLKQRRPTMDNKWLESRTHIVEALTFPGAAVVEFSTDHPLETTLGQIKEQVWRAL